MSIKVEQLGRLKKSIFGPFGTTKTRISPPEMAKPDNIKLLARLYQ